MNLEAPSNSPVETGEEEYLLSVEDLLAVLWRRLWAILLVAGLSTGAAIGFSLGQTPEYEASIRLLVGQEQRGGAVSSSLGSDVQGLQQLTLTVSEAVNTRPVANAVIEELNLNTTPEEFQENLSAEQVESTQFIRVDYTDTNPERANEVANAVGRVFSEQISEVSPSANDITATVWEQSVVPDDPVSPNPLLNGLIALVVGLMLGTGLAFLLEFLDDSWRSPEDLEKFSAVPTFGVIPAFKAPKRAKGGK